MCVVSMVHDHFQPQFLPSGTVVTGPVVSSGPADPSMWTTTFPLATPTQLFELRSLIDRFEKAVAAAKVVDNLTDQPDCVDPDKAQLERVVAYWKGRAEAAEKLLGLSP